MNISLLNNPGVYEILNVETNRSYYGESQWLLERIQLNFRYLKNGKHHCKALQQAYNESKNIDNFQVFIIASGPDWVDRKKRMELEDFLSEMNSHRCYNQTKQQRLNPPSRWIRPIMYKGVRYESVRGALCDTDHVKIARRTLINRLSDPAFTDVYYLEGEGIPSGSIPIFATKNNSKPICFSSINAAVRAKFAETKREANFKLKNNIDGWRYAGLDDQQRPLHFYTLQEGDITYEMYLDEISENEMDLDEISENE